MELYSIQDLSPIFEDMHQKIGFSTENFLQQNKIARTIWLAIRIDGEVKNGGVAQLFWNLRSNFDYLLFEQVLTDIGSNEGGQLLQDFREYLEGSEKRKHRFFDDAYFGGGMTQAMQKLHNRLSDAYYQLSPSIEALIINYAEANWSNADFQKAIAHLKFASQPKEEKRLIFDINQAIQSGNLSLTTKLAQKIENLNQPSEYGYVPLLEVGTQSDLTNQQKIALAKVLLENEADMHFTDRYGDTVLHKAMRFDNSETFIQFLIDQGANIEQRDHHNNTPIFAASTKPLNTEVLLKNKVSLHVFNQLLHTPLTNALREYAKWNGNPHAKKYQPSAKKVIKLLLTHGAAFHNGNITSNSLTDLGYAVATPALLKFLLSQQGVKQAQEFDPDFGGWSAVFEASLEGKKESLELLIKAGAEVNSKLTNAHYRQKVCAGATPLTVAKNKTIKKLLTDHGAISHPQHIFSVFLETRGQESSVTEIICREKNLDKTKAQAFWGQIKKEIDQSYERNEEGESIIYKTLLLQTFDNQADAQELIKELAKYNSIGIII